MITYNDSLFIHLFACYLFFNGLAWAWMCMTHSGESREWSAIGVLDGLVLVSIAILPALL